MEKNNSQNGFTLIEVLIAIAVLTIGILGAAAMQVASIDGNSIAIRITSAATLASDTHETLMALPYTASTTDPLLKAGAGVPVVRGNYTVSWNVTDDSPIANCKTIRVSVQRSDKGIMKTVTQNFTKMRTI